MKKLIVLYPTNRGRYYLRIRGQSIWFTQELYRRLKPLCKFRIYQPKPTQKRLPARARLEHRRIVFNTADRDLGLFPDPSRFAVPLETVAIGQVSRSNTKSEALGLPRPQIVGIRLHNAVVPRRRLVFNDSNNKLVIALESSSYSILFPPSVNRAGLVAAHIQKVMREDHSLPSFACCFHSGSKTLRLSCDQAFRVDTDASTAGYELGFREPNLQFATEATGQPLDFSGSRYLQLFAEEIKGAQSLLACVPMNDPRAVGLVYYQNPETGGDPRQDWPKPRRLSRLTLNVLNDAGQPYDFQQANSCYVFEITCLVAFSA